MLSLILLLLCGSSFTAGNGSASIRNIKVCVSFDKSHMSHLNIGWDGSGNEIEIIYKATGRNETTLNYESDTRMITGLKIENASIGSNLTVQLSPVFEGKTNRSDPITIVVNYVHDVKLIRISENHIQFNCTLACRSPITHCVVELNTTKNTTMNISSEMNKEDFSSWAIVDFFLPDTHLPFTYTVFAQGRSENILGQRVNGSIPPVSTVSTDVPNTFHLMNKSEPSTVFTSTTSSIHVTTTSIAFTQGNTLSTTVTIVSHTTAVDKEDENNSYTGLMVGVIITSLLVILLALMLLGVALVLWRQKKGKTSEVSSTKHISEGKHDMQNTSSQGNGQTSIKDKNHIAINAYEEIVDVPVYSKPLSTSNPMFLQTEKVKHSSLSSKKSLSSQRSFENLQEDIPLHVFDEKNKISENKSSNNRSRNHSLNENRSDHSSGPNNSQINFNPESGQGSSASTEKDNKEQENPYFELLDLTTKNFYENATILPLNGKTNKNKEYKKENTDSEKPITVCSKCQSLPLQGLGNRISQPADEPKRRSLTDYDEPVKVDQVIDPTTGHTYTLPILRKKE